MTHMIEDNVMDELPPHLVPPPHRWREILIITAVGLVALATSAIFVVALALVV